MIRPRNISFRRVRKLLLFTKFKIFTSPVLYRKRKKEKGKFNTEKDDAPLEFQSALLTSRISKRGKIKWRINKATRWTICPYPRKPDRFAANTDYPIVPCAGIKRYYTTPCLVSRFRLCERNFTNMATAAIRKLWSKREKKKKSKASSDIVSRIDPYIFSRIIYIETTTIHN